MEKLITILVWIFVITQIITDIYIIAISIDTILGHHNHFRNHY